MAYVPLEKLIDPQSDTSIYKLVLLAAKRANELAGGAQPLVKTDAKKAPTVALEEIGAHKVRYEVTKSKKSAAA